MTSFIIVLFIIWRVGLFFIAFIGEKILTFSPRFPYSDVFLTNSKLPFWIWSFANFDGVHYLTIARSGYSAQFTQVFFPLYPFIIGLISRLIPFISPIIVGFMISNLFFILSLIILWKLFNLDYKVNKVKWMILFLLLFPTSFYFGAIYTESLFMFLVFSSFYAARKKRWWLAGLLGALASANRLIGIFLLPAIIWEWNYLRIKDQELRIKNYKLIKNNITSLIHNSKFIIQSPVTYLIPIGLLSYMLYLQLNFGDWLYFWHAQPVFGAQRSGSNIVLLPQVIWRYLNIFKSVQVNSESFFIPLLEFTSTLAVIVLLIIAYLKKVRPSYLIFSFLAVITPTLTGTLSSMPRYVLAAFPIFITLGLIGRNSIKVLLLMLFCSLLAVLTVLFTRGHWVS